jgi:hypothetical protein
MSYFEFIKSTDRYLKSVRVIKDYISFDMTFSKYWSITKKQTKDVEVIRNESTQEPDKLIVSFVTNFNEESINRVEQVINNIIKTNLEREEKEKLFKDKVQELKNIFEKQKLDNLKGLKFDLDEFSLMTSKTEENGQGTTERDGEIEIREEEESEETQTG